MIWSSESINKTEETILDRDEGPIEFIEYLIHRKSAIAVWLTDDEHELLEEEEFIVLIYLVEVILKSGSPDWEDLLQELSADELADYEEELWKVFNKYKRQPVKERFAERILHDEHDLQVFIAETIEDFQEDRASKAIIDGFLWVCSLTIAGVLADRITQ